MKLNRYPQNPVLLPDRSSDWECLNVFNPGVILHKGLFHMFYRAQGLDWVSRIGYAVSSDGIHWNRLHQPVLVPHDSTDSRGVEDPRITFLDGSFYMTYTAYGRDHYEKDGTIAEGTGITPMLARSDNLITWQIIGPLVKGEFNKDHVLFPRQINGRYAAFHRRDPDVWIAYSHDLRTWREADMAAVYSPRFDNTWDCVKVGSNGVPIETPHGWLCFYHGVDHAEAGRFTYRTGVLLLDLHDPSQVIRRPKHPIFWPEELWELKGDVPNVVFSNANVVVNDMVYVYYGAADHVIGLATCKLADVVDYVLNG